MLIIEWFELYCDSANAQSLCLFLKMYESNFFWYWRRRRRRGGNISSTTFNLPLFKLDELFYLHNIFSFPSEPHFLPATASSRPHPTAIHSSILFINLNYFQTQKKERKNIHNKIWSWTVDKNAYTVDFEIEKSKAYMATRISYGHEKK